MDTLLDRFFGDWSLSQDRPEMSSPALDLTESDESFTVVAELPGMTEEDIELSVLDDVLTLSGEKTIEDSPDTKRHHTERRSGEFRREVRFSAPVDAGKVVAGFANGVLTVTLPKSDKAKARTIKINK
jgi:HSP20 family protein